MAEWHEIIKLGLRPRYSFCLWVTCLLILVVPFPDFLHIDDIRSKYSAYVGVLGVFTFLVWVVELVIFCGGRFWDHRTETSQKRDVLAQLDSLSPDELFLLARALFLNVQTIRWRSDHDEVSSLIAKGLLEKVPHESSYGSKPYTIPRFVWNQLLTQKEELLARAMRCNPDKKKQLGDESASDTAES